MTGLAVFLIAFAASAVEMVEAATVVLAMAITRGERSAVAGAASALVFLCAVTGTLSPVLQNIPLAQLRLVVGLFCLGFGGNWLRKAILRAAGRKAIHDEAEIFRTETQVGLQTASSTSTIDRLGFVVSAKAVLLEGVEVVVIVLAIGSAHGHTAVAALGAFVAFCIVVVAAIALRGPLTKVPENLLKLGVGIMLVSFGTFWAVEGMGIEWPAGDATIVLLIASYAIASGAVVRLLQRAE